MIAQFYNKFDELHEQSLTQALARSPNKITMKNEVKYRIPERWTKPFHKEDILKDHKKNKDQLGLVNKAPTI
jgi:phage regulator Rha-like protein